MQLGSLPENKLLPAAKFCYLPLIWKGMRKKRQAELSAGLVSFKIAVFL